MKKIAVIGSGSWGVALAIHLAKLGNEVKIWSFAKEEADLINNEKKCMFLPKISIPDGISCTLSYEEAIKHYEQLMAQTDSHSDIFLNYGYCLWFMGKITEAAIPL